MKGVSLVSGMIGVMIAVIIGGAVVIPIVTNVTAGLTGTEATVLGYTSLLIAVVIIVAVVSLIRA